MNSPRRLKQTGWFTIVIGLWAILLALWTWHASQPISGGIKTQGTVVGSSHPNINDYYPIVSFTDTTGQRHQVTSRVGSSFAPAIGATKTISYKSDDPDSARILGSADHLVLLAIPLGVVFMIVGALILSGLFGATSMRNGGW